MPARAAGDPAQLLREAKLMAQLASPYVVSVYDVIEAYGLAPGKATPRAIALVKEAKQGLSTSTLPLIQRELRHADAWLRTHGVEP
ncbi:hypothetical protein HPC49_09850 [Pyxidicoccus fallax]|uniref:Uncharacterized protein n=1 Tax=Pyxidicoccus fallax TaxID=394095 RepID=A0A848L9Z5_9BACT|nr:hypothetical protein [Pyxidicoccus fallax]NMO13503.1 hypothetical protein [Pyxidicoccus fallax]NPC78546.1 hypothetical protein [Pyxidicoccus fallax]